MTAWTTSGAITHRLQSGVFEFYQNSGGGGAFLSQQTTAAFSAGTAFEAQVRLGNSSGSRKRVTLTIRDGGAADAQACAFWLPPSSPLRTVTMTTYPTENWTDASVALYDNQTNGAPWARVDNVSLRRRPAVAPIGVVCAE